MERRRRSELQRIGVLFCAALCALSCAVGVPVEPRAEVKGERMLPNEQHHAISPCEEHLLAPGRVLLEVAIDEQGKPREALVTSLGGTVRKAFASCVQMQLLTQEYASRGKPVTLAAVVDLRVGAFSTAGSPTPIPPGY